MITSPQSFLDKKLVILKKRLNILTKVICFGFVFNDLRYLLYIYTKILPKLVCMYFGYCESATTKS
jgi:hypothetical protein